MLRLPAFTYLAPRTLEKAIGMLGETGADGMAVAGGTDLYPNMKRRQFEPKTLVGLRRIPELARLSGGGGRGITVGACVTLTQLALHPDIRGGYRALALAAGAVSTPPLRNMGTIGGNLCLDTRCNYYNQTFHWRKSIGFCMKKDGDICLVAPGSTRCWAISSTDTAPVAIALGAQLRLVGPAGERVIPAAAFYRDDGIQYLAKAPDELLVDVILPPADGWRSTYWKLRRRGSFDFPILGVAAAVRLGSNGRIEDARIVLGGVASHPVEAPQAAALLRGQRPTDDLLAEAAQAASQPSRPLDNADLTIGYRKKMTRVYVERALRELTGLPFEGEPGGGGLH
ncbi:MAG TPA: xanthine dehydrogenase family protein subunit M [bacterium]|nr:xanthine dehydrogenase family protein subunit M [bacterium]